MIKVGLNLCFLVPGEQGGMEIYARELVERLSEQLVDLEPQLAVGDQGHQHPGVDEVTPLVDHEAAVGVAVEAQPHVGALAAHRRDRFNLSGAGQLPENVNGAYASYDEQRKGFIKPGMLADIAVLSSDLFTIAPEKIESVLVDMTIVDGDVVFERKR